MTTEEKILVAIRKNEIELAKLKATLEMLSILIAAFEE